MYYNGEKVNVVGVTDVEVESSHGKRVLPLIVVGKKVQLQTLLSRKWLQQVKLDWRSVSAVKQK